jgi:anti-sigma factor RsiW
VIGGHLGSRVSALLDGQMSAEDAERAWAHVHTCHACRDLVEREGWVKTRLAGLSFGDTATPDRLKGSLLAPGGALSAPQFAAYDGRGRRNLGMVAIGGGAVGAAFVGVLALGIAPADAPPVDRRAPSANITRQPDAPDDLEQILVPPKRLHRSVTP